MDKLIIATYRTVDLPLQNHPDAIIVSEKQIGKCRGCLACRRVKNCINYDDDAQVSIPLINSASHLDFYLQSEGTIQRLMDRVLYALDGVGKTFTLHIADAKEAEYLRRLLLWAKYTEVQ